MSDTTFDSEKTIAIENLLGDETLRAIGLLFVQAAACDLALALNILRTTTNDQSGIIYSLPLIAGMNISAKLGVLTTIIAHRVGSPDTTAKLTRCLERIQKCFDRRNMLAHGNTMPATKPNEVRILEMKFTGERRLPPEQKIFTAKQITTWARELQYQTLELGLEFDRLGFLKIDPNAFILPQAASSQGN